MRLILINNSEVRFPRKFVQEWTSALGLMLKKQLKLSSQVELTIVFLDAQPARLLNLEFLGRDYATDILSFEAPDSIHSKNLGELILCPAVLEKQAKEHHHSFKAELGYMLIHGVLHLLGFEHEASGARGRKQAAEMYELQDRLFESLTTKFKL